MDVAAWLAATASSPLGKQGAKHGAHNGGAKHGAHNGGSMVHTMEEHGAHNGGAKQGAKHGAHNGGAKQGAKHGAHNGGASMVHTMEAAWCTQWRSQARCFA